MLNNIDNQNAKKCIYMKKYNEDNKDKLNEQFICNLCGGKYKKMNFAHHKKTNKHQNCQIIQNLKKDNNDMKNIIFEVNKKFENI